MKVWLVWDNGGDREAPPVTVFSEAEANTYAAPLSMMVLGPWEVDTEKPVVHPSGTHERSPRGSSNVGAKDEAEAYEIAVKAKAAR